MRLSIIILTMLASVSNSHPLYIAIETNLQVECLPSQDGFSVFIPHPSDCSLYYQCAGVRPVLMSCPGGLHFDYSVSVCNWPQDVECHSHHGDEIEEETIEEQTTEDIFEIQTIEAATEETAAAVNKDFQLNIVCPLSEDGFSVFVPHPTECGLYYHCDGATPILRPCPRGLHFDNILNVCNWPPIDCNYTNLEVNIEAVV